MKKIIIGIVLSLTCLTAFAQYTPVVYSYEGDFNEESLDFGLKISSSISHSGHTFHGDFLIILAQRRGSELYHFRLNSEYNSPYNFHIERISGSTHTDDIQVFENTSTAFNMEIRFDGLQNDWHRITIHQLSPPRGSLPTFEKIDPSQYQSSGTKVTTSVITESNNSVGIGTNNTFGYKLAVNGTIGSTEVKVENTSAWPDFVFENNYDLRTLEDVEQHINENGHLPEIPSEAEVTKNGINLGEMDAKLLQKVEELTLYMIDMNKRMKQIETENTELKEKVQSLENNKRS